MRLDWAGPWAHVTVTISSTPWLCIIKVQKTKPQTEYSHFGKHQELFYKMKLSSLKENISYTENILVVAKKSVLSKRYLHDYGQHTLQKSDQLISMPPALTCRIVSSSLYCREETDTGRAMLRFLKIPGDF